MLDAERVVRLDAHVDEPGLTSMSFDRFASAALVVAHPDDEALWFSSVVGRVKRVIIAYEACDALPGLGQARHAASEAYPLASALFLRRPEPCSLWHVDWANPQSTDYGMALNQPEAEARYRDAYAGLVDELGSLLGGISDVFTHNPWGEYGHPDHVQVSRVVTTLGKRLGFRTHFSNYVAPRSMRFASNFILELKKSVALESDHTLADRLKGVYVEHGCWTWHADYTPPETEAFLVHAEHAPTEADSVPLNCLMTT